jgi:hypothetical protein
MIYHARTRQLSYGRPVGFLTLEERIPCPPGTPGNPTTFPFPVCYEVVKGASVESLRELNRPDAAAAFLAAGQALTERGACMVAGNCGLMIVHQAALAAALPVPVLLSSLLQLPGVARMLGPRARIGVIASSRRSLKPEHLALAGAADVATVVASMDGQPAFEAAMREGVLDFEKAEAEAASVARALVAGAPDVAAILLECVDLPPYAAAIQDAAGVPVFDVVTLVSHAASALTRKPFTGVY